MDPSRLFLLAQNLAPPARGLAMALLGALAACGDPPAVDPPPDAAVQLSPDFDDALDPEAPLDD